MRCLSSGILVVVGGKEKAGGQRRYLEQNGTQYQTASLRGLNGRLMLCKVARPGAYQGREDLDCIDM